MAEGRGAPHPAARAAMLPRGAWLLFLETAVWLGIAVAAWILSYEYAGKDMLFRWGAEFWPRAVAMLMAALALVHLLVKYRDLAGAAPKESAGPGLALPGLAQSVKLGTTLALPLLFAFMLPRTGYYITTPFFIVAMMLLFGMRRLVHLTVTAICIYAAFLLVFSKLLFIPLPTGYWPGFYEVNTAVMDLLGF